MTVRPPSYIQAGSFTADEDRLLLASLLGGSPNRALSSGIVAPADYKVTQTGTPSMNLQIASGAAFITGSQSSTEGIYNVQNDDNSSTVTISTADATNPRIDLVVLQVRNTEYSGTHDDAILTVVKGTAAPSPSPPATPADAYVLAQVAVAAGASSIVNANITDERVLFGATNRVVSGHLSANYTVTGALATFLTTPALSVGTWQVTLNASIIMNASAASVEIEALVGTATATFEGQTSAEFAAAIAVQPSLGLDFIVTVTTAGTLIFQAKGGTSGNATVQATTGSSALPKATGFTAVRLF